MKRTTRTGILTVTWMALAACACAYETLQGPTETRYWDESRAYNGYTLYGARRTSYLVDMEGRVVHTWPAGTNPRLLDNGNLLDASTDDPSHGDGFVELDWDGNTVWEYYESRDGYEPHHDFVRTFNTNLNAYTTLYIANKTVTYDQAIAAGCDPANGPYDGAQMDAIVEVDMSSNIVWEWWFFDHAVQDIDPTKSNYVASISANPGRIDLNLPGRPVKRDWLHCNSLDYNAELDQIVVNSVQGEFYVIDHGATFITGDPAGSIALAAGPAGDFLYRFGDPARYEQGDPPSFDEDWTSVTAGHKQIGGAHDVQWIRPGLPGAGNLLIFNNGQYLYETTSQSYIFEINGYLNGMGTDTGGYVNPPDAGYDVVTTPNRDTQKEKKNGSRQITWQYYSKSNQGFFSHIGSGAQRLPNGNTLICAMTEGHIFEVTTDGELVWEYIGPVTPDGNLERLDDNWPMYTSMFRAYRYTADHPALTGKDLTPGDTITGVEPSYTYIPGTNDVTNVTTNAWSMLALPDTGQTGDYTATYGEDSDYSINPPTYTDNGNGTTSDNVTGLMWQQTDGGEMTWVAASNYAATLSLGGHDDWRLPTSHVLFSIMDHGRLNPSLDTNYFPATSAQYWWTADTRADDGSRVWCGNAGGGIGAHPTNETISAGGSKRFHVRCVRDPSGTPSSNTHDFTDNGDGTVTDENTGLVWQQTQAASSMTWEAALAYAEGLYLADNSDWRLPNLKELRSISDDTLSNPSLDATAFPGATASLFWSSTTEANQTNRAWTVDFRYGLVSYGEKPNSCSVLCVRGGTSNAVSIPEFVSIPAGEFEMGDHHGLGGLEHANDEIPVHRVVLDRFLIGKYEITCREYVDYLNAARQQVYLTETAVLVYAAAGNKIDEISVPERPTNLCFGGSDRRTLFITTEGGSLYAIRMRTQGVRAGVPPENAPPVITGVTRAPQAPTDADSVWVTATVTDDVSVAQVTLTHDDGSSGTGSVERTVFLETMCTAAAKPWTGDGCDNAWTVTANPAANVEQRTGANYGDGNPCGVEFHRGTVNLTDTMIETTGGIDATGISGTVEFWVWSAGLTNSQGWTFQLDAGSGYVTRLSELTASSHGWQQYHYELAPAELVGSLKMRFQFRGGDGDPRVDIDQISVKVTSAGGGGGGGATVPMLDDGSHQDGAAGDGRYGGEIPARSVGTTVDYTLTATDGDGAATTAPAGAAGASYSYTVIAGVTNRTVGLIISEGGAYPGYTLMAPKHYTNTLICDGTHGEFREVTPAGQVVWYYICPVQNTGRMTQGDTPSLDDRNHQYNAVFKIHR